MGLAGVPVMVPRIPGPALGSSVHRICGQQKPTGKSPTSRMKRGGRHICALAREMIRPVRVAVVFPLSYSSLSCAVRHRVALKVALGSGRAWPPGTWPMTSTRLDRTLRSDRLVLHYTLSSAAADAAVCCLLVLKTRTRNSDNGDLPNPPYKATTATPRFFLRSQLHRSLRVVTSLLASSATLKRI